MCAGGHEVKGSSDDGDELHDLYAHAGSPGNPAIRLAIRAPKFARLYALTATMRPVQFRRSPMAIIHRLATRLSIFSIRARMEALRNSLHAGALCRQYSSFCPPEWVGGRVHGAHLWDRTQVLAQDLATFGFGRVSRKRTLFGTL